MNTPVRGVAQLLSMGKVGAWHAKIPDRRQLGAYPTIFADLGTAHARHLVGRATFSVNEVMAVLRDRKHPDELVRQTIEAMIEAEHQETLTDRVITAYEQPAGSTLIDGNKRAVAIYEAGIVTGPLPIFLLRSL